MERCVNVNTLTTNASLTIERKANHFVRSISHKKTLKMTKTVSNLSDFLTKFFDVITSHILTEAKEEMMPRFSEWADLKIGRLSPAGLNRITAPFETNSSLSVCLDGQGKRTEDCNKVFHVLHVHPASRIVVMQISSLS